MTSHRKKLMDERPTLYNLGHPAEPPSFYDEQLIRGLNTLIDHVEALCAKVEEIEKTVSENKESIEFNEYSIVKQ